MGKQSQSHEPFVYIEKCKQFWWCLQSAQKQMNNHGNSDQYYHDFKELTWRKTLILRKLYQMSKSFVFQNFPSSWIANMKTSWFYYILLSFSIEWFIIINSLLLSWKLRKEKSSELLSNKFKEKVEN